MKPHISLSMLFAATVLGCASEPPRDGDPTPPDGGGGHEPQPIPTTPEGAFAVRSELDLATNLPGTAGTIATYFIRATDDPADPTLFIVEQVIAALPNGAIKNALANATPYVAGFLNDKLLEIAPTFVGKIVDLGDAFGQVAKQFGLVEVLEVDARGRAKKTVKGLHFEIDHVEQELAFADFSVAEIKLDGLTVTLEPNGKLSIGEHTVRMKYGQLMRLALDQAIIPIIDPSASGLADLLQHAVNCQAVGRYVHEAIGVGSASTFESACNTGLAAGAGALYNLMNQVDGHALELVLAGTARGVDRNRDGKMDEIVAGTYTGGLVYAGTPAPLSTARFFGTRL